MCAGGPPNPMHPIRPHSRRTIDSRGRAAPAAIVRSGAGGLEQLDRVARRVVDQDLLPARPADDVVAERQAGGAQAVDLGGDVFDDEGDAGPTSPLRPAAAPPPPARPALRGA